MARYEHLPNYKAALDMTVHFEGLVAGFSRYHFAKPADTTTQARKPILNMAMAMQKRQWMQGLWDQGSRSIDPSNSPSITRLEVLMENLG